MECVVDVCDSLFYLIDCVMGEVLFYDCDLVVFVFVQVGGDLYEVVFFLCVWWII